MQFGIKSVEVGGRLLDVLAHAHAPLMLKGIGIEGAAFA